MPESPLSVGYVLKQYPRLSETFILNEILGVERAGVNVSVFSLRHATEGRFHEALAAVQADVAYMTEVDKTAFMEGLGGLADFVPGGLEAAMDFVELLPPERRARTLVSGLRLAVHARQAGLDHLHAHFLTVAAHVSHIAHLVSGLPYSVTAHAKDIYRHTVDWDLAERLAVNAAAIVTVCDANRRHLETKLSSDVNLVRIYNGLGPQAAPVGLDDRERGLVVGLGRLVEKKGFDTLIDALAKLAPRRPDIRGVIVGDGDQRAALEAQVRTLGLEDRITFTGAVSQGEVATWLRRGHVFAAPCRVGTDGNQDALPTVLIEALGAGIPSITTDVAGTTEIIGHDQEGLIVDHDDSAALAGSIEQLIDDDAQWRRMSECGPHKLAARFDRQRTVAELVDVFSTSAQEA